MSAPVPPDPRAALEAALERLEAVGAELGAAETADERLRELADAATRLSAEVAALLPRVLQAPEGSG